jgi:hypothetical protein
VDSATLGAASRRPHGCASQPSAMQATRSLQARTVKRTADPTRNQSQYATASSTTTRCKIFMKHPLIGGAIGGNASRKMGELNSERLPAGCFGLVIERFRVSCHSGNLLCKVGIRGRPVCNPRSALREMSIEALVRQSNSEVLRQDSLRADIPEYAIEDKIACRFAVVRNLPEPAHWRQIGFGGDGFTRDAVCIAEIPQGKRLLPRSRSLFLVDMDQFSLPEFVSGSEAEWLGRGGMPA